MSKKPEQGRRPLGKILRDNLSDMYGGKKKEHQHSGNNFSSFWYIIAVYLDNNHDAWFLLKNN